MKADIEKESGKLIRMFCKFHLDASNKAENGGQFVLSAQKR